MKQLLQQPEFYLALLMIGGSAGCIATEDVRNTQKPTLPSTPPQISATTDLNTVTQVVQQAGPAVVRIDSTRTLEISPDPLLESFLGRKLPPKERVQRGIGSGFITSADGLILTNAHVVANVNNVTVTLKDGRSFQGNVVGIDRVTDVAVVNIKASRLPIVRLGNSDNLLPGQWAIAIGNPLGLDNTVTYGIISATQRSLSELGATTERVDLLQTDAAINPGNSGGPLLNAQGEVIGMNTAIIQGAQGLGFAIPINTAQRIAAELVTKGHVDHPYIGIQMAQLNPDLRAKLNQSDTGIKVDQDTGVVILRVAPNSPASGVGLRPGDIIDSIDSVAVNNLRQVQQQVEAVKVGDVMQIVVNRNGRRQVFAVRPEPLKVREAS